MTDDRHAEDLLAGYVDGSLSDRERAVVEAHLPECERCREESSLAMRAVAVLRDVPEEPVPVGVTRPIYAEIAQRAARTAPRPLSQRVLWAAGGAIAAAFIGVVAIWVIPGVGGSSGGSGGAPAAEAARTAGDTAGGATGAQAPGGPVALERRSTDYDDAALQRLAETAATAAAGRTLGGPIDTEAEPPAARTAATCLARGAGIEPHDVLVRLIAAEYAGDPAIVGVYLTGPSSDQPARTVLIWVVRSATCEFASFTQARI